MVLAALTLVLASLLRALRAPSAAEEASHYEELDEAAGTPLPEEAPEDYAALSDTEKQQPSSLLAASRN